MKFFFPGRPYSVTTHSFRLLIDCTALGPKSIRSIRRKQCHAPFGEFMLRHYIDIPNRIRFQSINSTMAPRLPRQSAIVIQLHTHSPRKNRTRNEIRDENWIHTHTTNSHKTESNNNKRCENWNWESRCGAASRPFVRTFYLLQVLICFDNSARLVARLRHSNPQCSMHIEYIRWDVPVVVALRLQSYNNCSMA